MADGGERHSSQAPISTVNWTLVGELAAIEAEIERLKTDNHRLFSCNLSLEHDLAVSEEDIKRLRVHLRTIKNESDIQIQGMLEKIAKCEAEISASESITEGLQQASFEAQGLLKSNQQLSGQIQQALQELEIANADIMRLPEKQRELDNMKKAYQGSDVIVWQQK
ncbi:hypothetical protein DCAR_0626353 [Daucus carota subsp. sativus]|uniref:Uncharacterized protein n=1 Tax=Daucus carota subsp. sativus TaxID=79200 RepID=A0A164X0M7_DAUCS|nr:hypothetical protein DCAR_0626353 [Daucus carota subsp. sativus]